MKVMGLDYGKARIGIALSDVMGFLATPFTTLKRTNLTEDISFLKKIILENSVKTVVIGLPLEMSGNKGSIAIETQEFAKLLSNEAEVEIVFVDERLSSIEAEEQLKLTIKSWEKRKQLLDQVAASIILQGYLDRK
ncbi:MAG: Holliday junction resolvase RuvX [Clostridiales bacterium]|nr:Holliday junction resolvase RuvX [Clostridiales bacterium]